MDGKRAIARAFLDAWCTREFDRLSEWVDEGVIEALRGALPAVPVEVRRADVTTIDDGLRFRFRLRVPSRAAEGHLVEEDVLVYTHDGGVTALDLFGSLLSSVTVDRSHELVAT